MKNSRQILGRWGEEFAARYLSRRGYTILERNTRTPYGEIDLVARQDVRAPGDSTGSLGMLVFVEVKTRSSSTFGAPESGIDQRKIDHMLASAQSYLQDHPDINEDWRIDVIAIQRPRSGGRPQITHFENAITR